MPKAKQESYWYSITVIYTREFTFTVEAFSEDEAWDKAEKEVAKALEDGKVERLEEYSVVEENISVEDLEEL